jgi:hypothetical protein
MSGGWGRGALAGLVVAAALGGWLAVTVGTGGERSTKPHLTRPGVGAMTRAGSEARFAFLASQRSNRCDLQAAEIMRYGESARLQGSCCSRMDQHAYREQVGRLPAYTDVPQIPGDPYDIPASLVNRLLRYDRAISLTVAQHRTYARAMAMSDEKGPCCCRCWRWTAFRGLGKFLIGERGWSARRLAALIDALKGCGGPGHERRRAART